MDLVDLIESRRFLGAEFLLWLWRQCELHDGHFELDGLSMGADGTETERVVVSFDDQLVLEGFLAETEQSRLTGGAPTHSQEARTALRAGKHVSKAKMRVSRGEREWVFKFDATEFQYGSVKVPSVLKEHHERILERLALIDELTEIWLALYRRFLDVRLSDAWTAAEGELVAWANRDVETL